MAWPTRDAASRWGDRLLLVVVVAVLVIVAITVHW
jgi:hypothetical protein